MTIDDVVGRPRTAAANEARQRRAARRRALQVTQHREHLDDEVLAVVVAVLAGEALRRGLEVPELFVE